MDSPLAYGRRKSVNVSSNKTLAAADAGIVQNVIADDITVTLPSTATAVVRAAGVPAGGPVGSGSNKSQKVTVAGTVAGGGGASAAVTFTLAKDDMVAGDEIAFVNGVVTHIVGNWVRA